MPLIAAALAACLSGCESQVVKPVVAVPRPAVTRAICPVPTPKERLPRIAAEIEAAIRAGVPPDALATEWERLHNASQICRGQKQ